MNVKQQLDVVKDYFALVSQDKVQPLFCPMEQGILLHHVDPTTDEVYLRCTVCGRVTYPGSFFFRALKNAIKQAER